MANDKPSSRREFLRGHSAARALLEAARAAADRAVPELPHPIARGVAHAHATVEHLHFTRRAMACDFAIECHATDGLEATDATLAALDLIEQLEDQLSIYRPHTEVTAINRTAAARPVEVEPRLFGLLELTALLYAETGGAFDITSAPLSRVWGFLKREGRLPPEEEIAAAKGLVGGDLVRLDAAARTISFAKDGVEINFNSIGKGYALDRVAELMSERGVGDYLCHGGRSSVLARGDDRAATGAGWRVAVPHPLDANQRVGEIVLRNEALGTSGAGVQFFEAAGRRFGHLIDPRTGWPAEGVFTATAVAATAAEADALATAFYVMGPGQVAEYCAAHPQVGAVMVCPSEGATKFDVHAFNLSDGRWLPAP